MAETYVALLITQRSTVPDLCQNGQAPGVFRGYSPDSGAHGQPGPKQIGRLSDWTSEAVGRRLRRRLRGGRAAPGLRHDDRYGAGTDPAGHLEPASPAEVAEIFSGCQAQWWIAGGYAIELAAGRPIRDHADIDVLMLRRDQFAVQQALPGWQWQAADPPGSLRPWQPGERLPVGVHDIWCRPGPSEPWRIQVMLDESSGNDWVSRRDERIRRPITSIGLANARGIPYLAPEIQLFYKGNNGRLKDETDFAAALPVLTRPQRQWLSDALGLVYGPAHPWRARLLAPHGAAHNDEQA